jgi:hypothetical protein
LLFEELWEELELTENAAIWNWLFLVVSLLRTLWEGFSFIYMCFFRRFF